MDYFEKLRVFRAVVEANSFKGAADMLGLTPPIISRGIAGLEKQLGSRLFHRTTRQISLTDSAGRVYERVCRILDELDTLEAETAGDMHVPTGMLRLVAHTTATLNRLVPLVSTFKRKYPDVRLELTLTELPTDLVADGFDLGIVLPYMLSSDLTVTKLLERIPLVIVATKEYLKSHPVIEHPSDLVPHRFVSNLPALRRPCMSFRTENDDIHIPINVDITSNNAEFRKDAVMQGFGIGVLPIAILESELVSGKLVRVLENYEIIDGEIDITLAYSNKTLMPARVRAFIDHATQFFDEIRARRLPLTRINS
ncbi:LysR family transcriptional regulator [Paraburkholderia sp. C35]|uniref:LysR family transcriptional regulator n=1 Tax=Paraburkholderia sp. C35 TaxID=2126993 RepID=UPI000D689F0E|nr:LysR family transcriptional regulator [Paraburkholderia sp. C35]